MTETPLLAIRNLVRGFSLEGKRVEVLRGLNLTVAPGEMVAMTGRSGAGKSTLLHLLGALDLPESGSIKFLGRELCHLDTSALAAHRNAHVGFVFQFHHLLTELSAVENVALPGRIGAMPLALAEERAHGLLERVGMTHRLGHRPSELSGGEQQRVALARALLMEPKLLLADEPTGNLDEASAAGIHDLLGELNQELGVTVILATHSRRLAEALPRRIHLDAGQVIDPCEQPTDPGSPALSEEA
jgi:lipoprotein-releasing system ATP-binding protein